MKEKEMSAKRFRKMVVLAVALVCVSAGYASADKTELQEKLSKDVNIKLKDVTIVEALGKIGEKAGVKFVLSDEAVWKLPQGRATRLSVALDGPLAESMTEMLNAFFMRYAVGDNEITIYPRPELDHILGRPTAKQLHLLREIYTAPMEAYQESPQKTINNTLGDVIITPTLVHSKIDEILYELAGIEEEEGIDKFDLPGPMTIANILDQIRLKTTIGGDVYMKKGKWYLSEITFPDLIPEIRVVNKMAFRQAKLDQIVDISFKDEMAKEIIQRLANWTGMELLVSKRDPSWLDEAWTISVDMQNVKLRQALRNIVSTIDGDISFDIQDNEINIIGPMHMQKVARPKSAATGPERSRSAVSEGYVGKISIPMDGGKYFIEFMLRENDLTEELKKLREEKMKEILGEKESKPKVKKKSSD
jgi:hypothetical protein